MKLFCVFGLLPRIDVDVLEGIYFQLARPDIFNKARPQPGCIEWQLLAELVRFKWAPLFKRLIRCIAVCVDFFKCFVDYAGSLTFYKHAGQLFFCSRISDLI